MYLALGIGTVHISQWTRRTHNHQNAYKVVPFQYVSLLILYHGHINCKSYHFIIEIEVH